MGVALLLPWIGIALLLVAGVLWLVMAIVWPLDWLARVPPATVPHRGPKRTWGAALRSTLVGLEPIVGVFSRDRWGEVFDTIRRNKLRTILTAVSVAWGIFVLVVLLGMGHGLNNGIRSSFRREAQNGIWINANRTSVAHAGYGIGRRITFDNHDYEQAKKVAGIDHLSGQYFIRGGRFGGGEMKVSRGAKANAFQVNAVHPDAFYLNASDIISGRYLNESDVVAHRKVAVVGRPIRDFLFDGADPVGQWIEVGSVAFQVVGLFSDDAGEENERQLYIPVSTAQLAFNGVDHLGMLMFTVGNARAEEATEISNKVVAQLAEAHQFSPEDKQAARVWNNVEGFEKFQQFFLVISIFVVVIGCGTLAAGVVGISNIMMIAVKERTKEIGIRKALGATPRAIVAMIVQEAVFLTSIAGLLGLALGVLALEVIPRLADTPMIKDPSVDIGVGVMAAVGLIFAGAIAGYIPARAAARVNPIHTLRDQ
jgi:putative ABC transport system permease protein